MSYQVLARKWRPANFEEMTGQQHVLRALINALEHDRLHHAYLFSGTRGVGKTTVARILAKCLNCERGVSANPCGVCSSCVEIAEGRSVDLIEVDAASRTKVDDTRELLDNVQYAPTRSRFKIYLIDEVHMLSNHSFNALLKTLEEPPPHAKFLLATTDPQKLPATVLSRCLQFNLKNMVATEIVARLDHILTAENIGCDQVSLQLIARAASGSMRDALSLTDQAIAFGGGQLEESSVRSMLGTVDRTRVLQLVEAVLAGDPQATMAAVADISDYAADFDATLDEVSRVLHQITIAQLVPESLDPDDPDNQRIAALASSVTVDQVQLCYQFAVAGRSELALASDPRVGLEMVLLRMIAFRPATVVQDVGDGEGAAKKPEPPVPPVVSQASPDGKPRDVRPPRGPKESDCLPGSAPSPGSAPGTGATARDEPIPRVTNTSEASIVPADGAGSDSLKASPGGSVESPRVPLLPADWPELYESLGLRGLLASVLLHTELASVSGNTLHFVLDSANATLYNPRQLGQLQRALTDALGLNVTATVSEGVVGDHTPAASRAREARLRLAQAEEALAEDSKLQTLIQVFDGKIVSGSVRPPSRESQANETQ